MDLRVLNTLESSFADHLVKLIDQTDFSQSFFTTHHALDVFSMDLSAPFQLVDLRSFPATSSLCTLFGDFFFPHLCLVTL